MIKILIPLLAIVVLSGCASSASPQKAYHDGNYYLTGDNNCSKWRPLSQGRIMCYKSDGVTQTGYRTAMTQADMQMYMYQRQQEQIAIQQMNNSINELGNSMQRNAALMNQSTQNMNYMNQNYNWSQPQQRKTTYCHQAGNFITCN